MSGPALLNKFENEIELRPGPGAANIHIVHPKSANAVASKEDDWTEADWDKFDADIDEAFEKLA